MKKLVLIALLTTAGLTQLAHANPACPEGTYWTPVGLCQPDFDFD
ncbi:hypothetical protein N5F23_24340 [Pseudomonas sichuanensis]|nr:MULTISPECIES: hypothetical protein [Pseudomonas]MDH0729880.1 hypothetical protein [Pseudomonas sichuanensis]MDH1585728.1 hypothetical protein [Pseudomonas sichuanensis]MDH1595460.1 hypothetical protein [Pseudomonas sichuanensis]MDH1600787.1 hypothetical protein [Pseudomonas sichuanensis]MDU9405803.1 hypothetical protein [Pseudomonas sp. zfem004]